MRYLAKTIANFFLSKSFETGVELSPMKLIKLVYLAHGWNLGLTGKPLISEAVQAWKYGPVIQSLYREFKFFGNSAVTKLSRTNEEIEASTKDFLNKIWNNYSSLSAVQLSSLTHEKGSPWCQIWHGQSGKFEMGAIIPDEIIRNFYKVKLNA